MEPEMIPDPGEVTNAVATTETTETTEATEATENTEATEATETAETAEASEPTAFAWIRGAVWLLPGGNQIIIPSFHDEWIRSHQNLVPGCVNVCDVVLHNAWLSVVAYSQGYVEIMIDSRKNQQSVALCTEHLRRNRQHWKQALIMTMDAEGYINLNPEDFDRTPSPESRIQGDAAPDQGGGVTLETAGT
jgi:hypothetical protein